MSSLKEAFANLDSLQASFYIDQQTKYQEYEPNRLLPDKMKGNLGPGIIGTALDNLASYDPYTGRTTQRFTAAGLNKVLQGEADTTDAEKQCRNYMGLSGLEQLIRDNADNPNNPVRCGWRYKPSRSGLVAEIAQGALGTRKGPINNNAVEDKLGDGILWIWNLEDARKRMLRDIANALGPGTSLNVLNSIQGGALAGKFAYCASSRRIIPVNAQGKPLYPNDQTLNCGVSNIITDPAQIPSSAGGDRNGVQSGQATALASLQTCATARNTPLSRDCFLQAIKNNGCSDGGTLYQALQLVNPAESRWDNFLQMQPSFTNYQSMQGGNAITDELFKKNMGKWEMAVNDVSNLHKAMMSSSDPYVRISAQDLCTTAGKFDNYDFCSDITDDTKIESTQLNCIQSYWQQQNGKPAGKAYPTKKVFDVALGTNIRTWGDYKIAVNKLRDDTNNPDPYIQRNALYNFYGVKVGTVAFAPNNLDGAEVDTSAPCLGVGKPSADNNIRVYTKQECDKLNGNWYNNGECVMQTGGSYSWNCRYLNAQEPKSSLIAWFDANDGSTLTIDTKNGVRDWVDKSGKGNNIRQNNVANRPVYGLDNNNAYIRFNGNNSSLPLPNAIQLVKGYFTIFMVEQRESDKSYNCLMGGSEYGANRNLVLGYRSNTDAMMAFWGNDLDGAIEAYRPGESARIWCFHFNTSGRAIYINGRKVAADGNKSGLVSWTGGSIGVYASSYYQGKISEILIYNPSLDNDAKRVKIEGYLANKWGITGSLDSSHPYKTVAP
jgi:hypothetical protein